MTRLSLLLLLGIAACGPALAQKASVTAVSPPLSQEDFRRPIVCSGASFCAVISPELGQTRYAPPKPAARRALRKAAALLPGPTPRPQFIYMPQA